MIYAFFYRLIMKIAHHHNWHYAPPVYPNGDTQLWCQWCGFRQTIKRNPETNLLTLAEAQKIALKASKNLERRKYHLEEE